MSKADNESFSELDSGSFGSIGLPDEEMATLAQSKVEDFFDQERNPDFRHTSLFSPYEIPNRNFKELGRLCAVLKDKEIKMETIDMPENESEESFWQEEEPEEEKKEPVVPKPESTDFFGEDNEDYEKTPVNSRYNPPNKDYHDLGSMVQIVNEMLSENVDMPQRSDDEGSEEDSQDRHSSSALRNRNIDPKNADLLNLLRKRIKDSDDEPEQSDDSEADKKHKPEKKKTHVPAKLVLEQKFKELTSRNKNVMNQEVVIPDELEGEDALKILRFEGPEKESKKSKPKTSLTEAASKPKVLLLLTEGKAQKGQEKAGLG